jgi:nucleoid-associated protein Lsr2
VVERVIRLDDLDESEGAEQVRYMWEGQEYEIDLSAENKQKFHSAIQPYLEKSRKVEPAPPEPASITRATGRRRSSGGAYTQMGA